MTYDENMSTTTTAKTTTILLSDDELMEALVLLGISIPEGGPWKGSYNAPKGELTLTWVNKETKP